MRLEHLDSLRPTTFALTYQLLELGKARIEKVAVTAFRDDIYYGTIWLLAGSQVHEVDARPSDAIALAMHAGAPIFVSSETFDRSPIVISGHELAQLEERQQTVIVQGRVEQEAQPMVWKSVGSLPRGGLEPPSNIEGRG
jgi:hypothetical protein